RHRVRLPVRDLLAVTRSRDPVARRIACRDCRPLRQTPRRRLARHLRGRRRARALPERPRPARAAVPEASRSDGPRADAERATIPLDADARARALRLARIRGGQGIPRGDGRGCDGAGSVAEYQGGGGWSQGAVATTAAPGGNILRTHRGTFASASALRTR